MENSNISNSKNHSERKVVKFQVFSEWCKLFDFSVLSVFENFFPKSCSNSNKKVIFGISEVRSIWLCSFRPKTEIVLDFWITRTLDAFLATYSACRCSWDTWITFFALKNVPIRKSKQNCAVSKRFEVDGSSFMKLHYMDFWWTLIDITK